MLRSDSTKLPRRLSSSLIASGRQSSRQSNTVFGESASEREKTPAPAAEPARRTMHGRGNVRNTGGRSELSHSFVSCAHVGTCNYGSADIDAVHRLILPARRVSSTDHSSIGAALVASIEAYICGSTFQEWCMRYKAKGMEDVEICLSMDSHSANAKMADILSIYVKSLGSAIGITISVFNCEVWTP